MDNMIIEKGKMRAELTSKGACIEALSFNGVPVGTDGITVGRYANRISGAKFVLLGKEYRLSANENGSCLHGGTEGFSLKDWTLLEHGEDYAVFELISEDGDQGFPGRLTVRAEYRLTENSLSIKYSAKTDAPTVINLTNHLYFNLNGGGPAKDHMLQISAGKVLEADEGLIPTGRLNSVFGTRFDHTTPKFFSPGFDNCYALYGSGLRQCAVLKGIKTGIIMRASTDQPGMQLYNTDSAICLEMQHFPDSPNRPEFPDTTLLPGQIFEATTVYSFEQEQIMTKKYRAPGRTELGGNHTDHQHGKVLAAGIDLYITAEAVPSEDGIVRISSEGYPDIEVDLKRLDPNKTEYGSSAALVRGVAAGIKKAGYEIGGFSARLRSEVLSGSGLSSSAAYEVLIGRIINDMYCEGKLTDVQIAQIGQYAENIYFGKPCGLMDQMACSVGSIIAIDLKDPADPLIERIDCRFEDHGYTLCIIDTHSEHADLTDDYAAIPAEMKLIARHFGKEYLRDVDPEEFDANRTKLKVLYGDRPVKRAMHFFAETKRAQLQAYALKKGRFNDFLKLVNESGRSSEELLQNIVPSSHPENTAVKDSLALARRILSGRGAVRVHGGGFAGTIQAYVPLDETDRFREEMEKVLGPGSCHFLSVSR